MSFLFIGIRSLWNCPYFTLTNTTDVANYTISGSNKKHGVGINTEKCDYLTNSARQDNLGQILLSMLSFRHLKESGVLEKFQGLLLIDEVDSTLYP